MQSKMRRWSWRLMAVAVLGVVFLTGCDDQTRLAVENGIIDVSTSFVGALLQAGIEVASE